VSKGSDDPPFLLEKSNQLEKRTNVSEPPSSYTFSRGYLVSSLLLSDSSHPLEEREDKDGEKIALAKEVKYAGFNLLLLSPSLSEDSRSLYFNGTLVTNGGGGGVITSRPLSSEERRCGGLSNGKDGQGGSEWPNVKQGTRSLDNILRTLSPSHTEADVVNHLFDLLT
jgi:uncharacterized protein with NRDE domain